jgi:peroxiredoxin
VEANQLTRCKLSSSFIAMVLSAASALSSSALPRSSPEFRIDQPGGKTILLSSLKGKVVVLEFLFVKSQHCMRVARTLNQLQQELGPGGMQAVGVAFDAPNAAATGGEYLDAMAAALNLSYPVGLAQTASVDAYLGRTGNEMLSIPQLIVIDRAGIIRAATGGQGNPSLEDANALRALVSGLLKESAAH